MITPADGIVLQRIWPPGDAPPGWHSHIGGRPNLPMEIAWPRVTFAGGSSAALDFLAQIDLAALPETYERGLLPREGTLYFFAVSNAIVPLHDVGSGAWRVLYLPRRAVGIPPRAPPADAGWGQQDMDHARATAAEYRDPEAPAGALHPYCPVRAVAAPIAAEAADAPRPARFTYAPADLPLRVEDAVLHLNFARNAFFETIVPLAGYLDYWKTQAIAGVAFAAKQGGKRRFTVRPWQTFVLSETGLRDWADRYDRWRSLAARTSVDLRALGRAITLTPAQRAHVSALVHQASAMREQISGCKLLGLYPAGVASLSLATLLRHDPGLARRCPEEVAEAAPNLQRPHRMLGSGRSVQGGTMGGADPILLLQLESDDYGPRFTWWDAGNLTFWISVRDAAARNFGAAEAEIEGH